MLSPSVEKWRPTVESVIAALQNTADYSSINASGLTIGTLEDTLLAIIEAESSGNDSLIGDNGNSFGLMQLDFGLGTPQGLGYTGTAQGLLDPYTNIYYGTLYFLQELARYGDVNDAILSYNAGSVQKDSAGVPINQNYLTTVLSYAANNAGFFLPSRELRPSYTLQPGSQKITSNFWGSIKSFFSTVYEFIKTKDN